MLIKATLQTELTKKKEREKRGDERSKQDKKISVMVLAGKS